MTVKLSGFKELDKALAELPKATAKNVLKRTLTKAGQPVLSAMISGAPVGGEPYYIGKGDRRRLVSPGYKKDSLALSHRLNPANKRDQRRGGNFTAEIYIGSRRGSTAHWFEYGTFTIAARPYLAPAWVATKDRALGIIKSELGAEIQKAANRLAKKRAKA